MACNTNMSRMTKMMLFPESEFSVILTLIRKSGTNVQTGNGHTWTIYKLGPATHHRSVVKEHLEAQTTEQDQWLRVCKHLGSQSHSRLLPVSIGRISSRPIRKARRHEGRAFTAIYRANCYNANENMMLQFLRFSVLSACYIQVIWLH